MDIGRVGQVHKHGAMLGDGRPHCELYLRHVCETKDMHRRRIGFIDQGRHALAVDLLCQFLQEGTAMQTVCCR